MSIKYLASCSWSSCSHQSFQAQISTTASQHSRCAISLPWPESIPMQQESSPEQCWVVMLQLGACCLSPSTYSDLCSLSFPLPNKQTKKKLVLGSLSSDITGDNTEHGLTLQGQHQWPSEGQHPSTNLSAVLSTHTHTEQHLEPASLLSLPASMDRAKSTLILNNGLSRRILSSLADSSEGGVRSRYNFYWDLQHAAASLWWESVGSQWIAVKLLESFQEKHTRFFLAFHCSRCAYFISRL